MDAKRPLVSIIAPTFNVQNYIKAFIECALHQTYINWELILVDDISTDATTDIILHYSKLDNRIKYIQRKRKPKGAQTCRNIGLQNAAGKYAILFDSDDLFKPYCLEQRVAFMEEHPDIDYAIFLGGSFSEDKPEDIKTGRWGVRPKTDVLEGFLRAQYSFSVWNNIYKLHVAKEIMWDEKVQVYQDLDFIIQGLLKPFKYEYVQNSKVDYLYRQGRAGSITKKFITAKRYQSTKYLFSKVQRGLLLLDRHTKYKKDFYSFYLLQFERVLIDGTNEQKIDFYKFIKRYYGFPYNIKLLVIKNTLIDGRSHSSREVRFILYGLYSPLSMLGWGLSKFRAIRK